MWIVIILVVLAFIVGKFLNDRNQQAAKISRQGGMRNKYRVLMEFLMSGDSRSKIYQETSDSITLGISNIGGTTLFIVTQTFGNITVQWKHEGSLFGKQKLEWDFPEDGDQVKMIERIADDTDKFQRDLMDKMGYSDMID